MLTGGGIFFHFAGGKSISIAVELGGERESGVRNLVILVTFDVVNRGLCLEVTD
jgi:hypothetical protein